MVFCKMSLVYHFNCVQAFERFLTIFELNFLFHNLTSWIFTKNNFFNVKVSFGFLSSSAKRQILNSSRVFNSEWISTNSVVRPDSKSTDWIWWVKFWFYSFALSLVNFQFPYWRWPEGRNTGCLQQASVSMGTYYSYPNFEQ